MSEKRWPGIVLGILMAFPTWVWAGSAAEPDPRRFNSIDVFQLEYAADPRISPDGSQIVYVRNFMDIMTDRRRSNLWIIQTDGSNHRPLTTGNQNDRSPRWSPDGKKLLYLSGSAGSRQIYVRWMDTGQTAKLTNLAQMPSGISWSPDGKWIAFSMWVPTRGKPFVSMPSKPKGAKWAAPARVIDKMLYRADGAGYLEDGNRHIFVLSAEGGASRQLTTGPFNHGGSPSWSPDGKSILISANRHKNGEYDPQNSEVLEITLRDGAITSLTSRQGPDWSPVYSPDGKQIAYLGFDDHLQGYQVTRLYVMNRDGSGSRVLTEELDRSVGSPHWRADGKGLFFQYTNHGDTKIAMVTLKGGVSVVAGSLGGTSLGRPYGGGSFSVADNGRFAFTITGPDHPADVASGSTTGSNKLVRRLTHLNQDLFYYKQLGEVEEIWFQSSFDDREIQGWLCKPPGFDPNKKYPLLLEIHGGPFANYGNRFTAEIQLYAAAGYVVLFANPRGSTSYGEVFGNLIHHNYPGQDYDDLMSGVDAVLAKGYIDSDQLYVTGGSGGGVLTSWIVGKTTRFRAAVVAKPVINWYSFVLTADSSNFFYKYWFPGFPWDHAAHYLKRSPISLVGKVETPTMLLTGEEDYRTPISETEQFYQALKLRKVDTVMVRIPGASHGIASRPSNLIAKVAHILKWFQMHRGEKE